MSAERASDRVARLAQQLLAEGYVSTEAEALLAAEEVFAAADAMPSPADGGVAKPAAFMHPEPEEPSPT
jgi:hypothetical protein